MPDLTVGVDGRRARTGANVVVRSLADIRNAAARTGRSVNNLDTRMKAASTTAAVFRRALAGLGAGLLLREFVRLGDSFVNVSNRLKIATDTTEELVAVQERLFQISQATRSNYESNATLFNRLALSSRELGISLGEVLDVTESLNQAVILSGAATTEASAGLIQLSQGLASNRLSGDELRSILEQLPVVAETIANSLGITRGELKFFGEQGKLSADVVFKAFREAREELAVRFGETVPTVAQSFVILRNAAIRFVGQLNESTGVITNLSRVVIFLANNFDTLIKGITVAAAALGPLVFGRSIAFATRALIGFSALILSNPIGLLVSGLAAATAAAIAFGDEPLGDILEESESGFTRAAFEALGLADAIRDGVIPAQTTLGDVARGVLQSIIGWVTEAANFLRDAFLAAINKVTEFLGLGTTSWADFFNFIRRGINNTIGFFVGLGRGVFTFYREINTLILRGFTQIFEFAKEPIAAVVDFAMRALNFVKGFITKIFGETRKAASSLVEELGVDSGAITNLPLINEAVDIGGKVKDAFLSGFETDYVGAITDILAPAIGTVIENTGEITARRLADQAAKLRAEGADLSKPRGEGKLLVPIDVQKALKKLIEETATPLETQVAKLKELARIRGFAQTAEEITAVGRAIDQTFRDRIDAEFDLLGLDDLATIMNDARGPLENYNIALTRLNELLAEGAINQDQFDAAVMNAKENILGLKDITQQFAEEAARNIQSAFADFLFDPFSEGLDGMARKFGETLRRITSEILSTIILRQLLEGLTGFGGGIGGFANLALGALAEGGPARAGQSYVVGENGPEIFTPRQSGMVVPNEMIGAASSPTVNVAPTPVVVLDDPAKIGRALQNNPDTQRALIETMATRKGAINQALR